MPASDFIPPDIPAEGVITSPELRAKRWKLLALAGGGLFALALAFFKRKEIAMTTQALFTRGVEIGKELAFQLALPKSSGYARYAPELLKASRDHNVNPWLLVGIMAGESNAGAALTPPDASGTGDFIKRPPGRKYLQPSGAYYTVGATGLPEDGLGWGRGLMQVDYGVHNEWIIAHDWRDPVVNIGRSAALLAENFKFFAAPGSSSGVNVECWRIERGLQAPPIPSWRARYPNANLPQCPGKTTKPYKDPRPLSGQLLEDAALAAYNAGPSGVLQAVAIGLPPDAATFRGNYADWIRRRIAPWLALFR